MKHYVHITILAAIFALSAACALFTKENAPKSILTLEQIACIAERAFLNEASLNVICDLITAEQKAAAQRVVGATRMAASKEIASRAGACGPTDAGASEGGAR